MGAFCQHSESIGDHEVRVTIPMATQAKKSIERYESRARREELQATAVRSLLAPLVKRAEITAPVRVQIYRSGVKLSMDLETALEGVRQGLCAALGVSRWSSAVRWTLSQERAPADSVEIVVRGLH